MAKSAAERAREYRARRRVVRGTAGVILHGAGNVAALRHGGFSAALAPDAAGLPDHLRSPLFADALASYGVLRERERRIAAYVDSMPIEEAMMPSRPGSSAPVEVARMAAMSAATLRAALGLTPASAARLGRSMAGARRDLALEAMMAMQAGEWEDGDGEQAG